MEKELWYAIIKKDDKEFTLTYEGLYDDFFDLLEAYDFDVVSICDEEECWGD